MVQQQFKNQKKQKWVSINKKRITRRQFIERISVGTAGAILPGISPAAERKPNFILILVDDLGWNHLGCMGNKFYETPNIDRLAKNGVLFTSAYSNAPNCTPTRACIMSGQYTPRHGVYTTDPSEQNASQKLIPIKNSKKLGSDVTTIAEALKPGGYYSASLGKWNLTRGSEKELLPEGQGFDFSIGKGGGRGRGREEASDILAGHAIDVIEKNRSEPLFIYFCPGAVHHPWHAKEEIIRKYENKPGNDEPDKADYAAVLESLDSAIGKIMKKLDDLKLSRSTIIIFFSDNGSDLSNGPLKGKKGLLDEGGIRVPCIISWSGIKDPGRRNDIPVTGIDFYPTILDITGIKKPSGHILDGESLVPILKNKKELKREAVFWHFPLYQSRTKPAGVIRQGDYKLIEYFEDNRLELYDLKKDIGEKNNLASVMPEKAGQMLERMKEWRRKINAPVPEEKNPDYDSNARPGRGKEGRGKKRKKDRRQ